MRSASINCGIDAFSIKVECLRARFIPLIFSILALIVSQFSSWEPLVFREVVHANACEWSRMNRNDARYPKRKSAAIPARYTFSNVPRMGTVIDKTIRKLSGLLEIIDGSRRSVRNIVLRFSFEPILCDFSRGNKGNTIVCVIDNLLSTKALMWSDKWLKNYPRIKIIRNFKFIFLIK